MREGGINDPLSSLVVMLGASADICIGLAIISRATSRYGLYAALTISVAYAIIGTILVPRLWADPLGPMLKIWPVMVLNLVALAIREDR
jgi:MFS superfamily sulfate permease-like transporter